MAAYKYKKEHLKGLGIRGFLSEVKIREKHIKSADDGIPKSVYNPNVLAGKLHPNYILGKIKEVKEYVGAKGYVIEPFTEGGFTTLPYFRAGQYISFEFDTAGKYTCRPYSICSSPKCALGDFGNTYEFTVGAVPGDNHISSFIHAGWNVGTVVCFSAPQGQMYYEPLRDAKHILGICGGPTPFLSMADAVSDGTEDFSLTVLWVASHSENLFLRQRFDEAVKKSGGKVRFIPVLTDEVADGCERGPLNAELIRKYMTDPITGNPTDTSVFINAPDFMFASIDPEIKKLGLPRRRIRREAPGYYGIESDLTMREKQLDKCYRVRVVIRGESRYLTCKAGETLLVAMENAGIRITSDCRSGFCGWCRSRLIKGEYYMPASRDGRREADRKFGWIHPCCTYPLSDIELEVFPVH